MAAWIRFRVGRQASAPEGTCRHGGSPLPVDLQLLGPEPDAPGLHQSQADGGRHLPLHHRARKSLLLQRRLGIPDKAEGLPQLGTSPSYRSGPLVARCCRIVPDAIAAAERLKVVAAELVLIPLHQVRLQQPGPGKRHQL